MASLLWRAFRGSREATTAQLLAAQLWGLAWPNCLHRGRLPTEGAPQEAGWWPIFLIQFQCPSITLATFCGSYVSASPHSQDLSWTPGPGGSLGHHRGLCGVGDTVMAICGNHSLVLWKLSPAPTCGRDGLD